MWENKIVILALIILAMHLTTMIIPARLPITTKSTYYVCDNCAVKR